MILLVFAFLSLKGAVAFDLENEPTHSPEIEAIFKQFENVKTKLIEEDIVSFQSDDGEEAKMSALKGMSWVNGDVPVEIHSAYATTERKAITDAMQEIHQKTCVRFRQRRPEDRDYILVVKPPNNWECSSSVGRIGGAQRLNLDPSSCLPSRKVVLHELMHALGFIHEQNRADRDDYVRIVWENVQPTMKHNFVKRNWKELTLMDTGYAYDSIMHYGETLFATRNGLKTIVPHKQNVQLGGWERLSDIDVLRINRFYGCGGQPAPPTQPPQPPVPQQPCGNGCMWTMQIFSADPHSSRHYLHCTPSFGNGDMRCGTWVRRECIGGMKFNPNFGMCSFW